MRRITCRVGDVPRTCCETQSSPRSPHSPLFLGRPGGRGGHDGTPIVLWITWPDSMVDHSRIPWFFTWETWAITWVSPDHLGHRRL